jgi:hypothetical protein
MPPSSPVSTSWVEESAKKVPSSEIDSALKAAFAGELTQAALADAERLSLLAKESASAAESLHTLASMVAHLWERFCVEHPDKATEVLRKKSGFPCNYPVLRKDRKRLDSFVETVGLGVVGPLNLGQQKQRNLENPAMHIASGWVLTVRNDLLGIQFGQACAGIDGIVDGSPHEVRIGLPAGVDQADTAKWQVWQREALGLMDKPFNQTNAPLWAEAIWRGIMLRTNDHPERDSELKRLGKYRENHSVQIWAQKAATPKTRDHNVRDGIKTRIQDAVLKLAPASVI